MVWQYSSATCHGKKAWLETMQNIACGMQKEIGWKGGGGGVKSPLHTFLTVISYSCGNESNVFEINFYNNIILLDDDACK